MRCTSSLLGTVHATLAAAAFVACMTLAPTSAHASGAPSFDLDGDAVAQTVLLSNALVFGGLDILFIAIGRPMPMWLSIMQIAIAGAVLPYLAINAADSVALQVAAGASAVLFTSYGIYDIARYPAWRRQKLREREIERARELCGIAIEPRPQGALLHVYGRM